MLDTCTVSELRKARAGKADRNLSEWAAGVSPSSLYMSAITVLELETGVLLLERRDPSQGAILRAWLEGHVLPAFSGRILPVDTAVARRCARLHIPKTRPERDALIAATALVHGMAVATRNVGDFAGTGVEVVDPWRR